MKKSIRLFTTLMVCMAMTLCVSCKKDSAEPSGGNTGGGTGGYGIGIHEYVDLGLPSGLLWATYNVGADKPEDYGDYFAWGETEVKSAYNWNTYKWYNGDWDILTKYCISSSYGTVDNKTVLDIEDDAAYVNWGEGWCMPTCEEVQGLKNTCTWTWTTQGGKDGYRVTGRNGNSVFLPRLLLRWQPQSCGFLRLLLVKFAQHRQPEQRVQLLLQFRQRGHLQLLPPLLWAFGPASLPAPELTWSADDGHISAPPQCVRQHKNLIKFLT